MWIVQGAAKNAMPPPFWFQKDQWGSLEAEGAAAAMSPLSWKLYARPVNESKRWSAPSVTKANQPKNFAFSVVIIHFVGNVMGMQSCKDSKLLNALCVGRKS